MTNVLRITTSILGEGSVSSQLMDELIAGLRDRDAINLVERDFSKQAIPHLDGPWLKALSTPEADRDGTQQQQVEYSDSLIAELQHADVLVIGLPMYNFSVPSMLKAWIDHVARAGVTFKYTENGPVGLLEPKKVYVLAAMGGEHEAGATDFLRPYMKLIFSFIGLEDVEFVSADGLSMSRERREQGLRTARGQIENIVAEYGAIKAEEEVAA
tara:strand:- start:110 stop:748 length:639 start_codon:yes stop_codon:yes gene_type:complete